MDDLTCPTKNTCGSIEGGEDISCFNTTPEQSVWFSFVATDGLHTVIVDNLEMTSCDFSSAVYDGSGGCVPAGPPLSCDGTPANTFLQVHYLSGLIVGNTYYVQVVLNTDCFGTSDQDFCITVQGGLIVSCPSAGGCTCSDICRAVFGKCHSATLNGASACVSNQGCQTGDNINFAYKVTPAGTTLNITVDNLGGGFTGNVEVVVWEGPCASLSNTQSQCGSAPFNPVFTGLTPGIEYFIFVASSLNESGAGATFDICISDNGAQCGFEGVGFCDHCNNGIVDADETGVDCGGADCDLCHCFNGIQDVDETGIDCGGADCNPCPTCSDGIWNGDETAVDCGGSVCLACHCLNGIMDADEVDIDCGGADCPPCVETCSDGVMNQDETGIDCGGVCGGDCCANGYQDINLGEGGVDCGGTCPVCLTCCDGIQNQGETSLDCGGPNCPVCVPTCSDGLMNQDETGIDCGGVCPACDIDDCATAVIITPGGGTVSGSSSGMSSEGGEIFPSCGGLVLETMWYFFFANGTDMTVNIISTAQACNTADAAVYSDGCLPSSEIGCNGSILPSTNPNQITLSGLTVGNTYYIQITYYSAMGCGTFTWDVGVDCDLGCVAPGTGETCCDGIQNQDETGIDCGGICGSPPTCFDGIQQKDEIDLDCGNCCVPCSGTCSDGIKNQGEIGIDCGGPCPDCPNCLDNISCFAAAEITLAPNSVGDTLSLCFTDCNTGAPDQSYTIAGGCPTTDAYQEVWYQITATGSSISIVFTSSDITDPQLAIWNSGCTGIWKPPCWEQGSGGTVSILDWETTSGEVLNISVSSQIDGQEGNFELCIYDIVYCSSNNYCGSACPIPLDECISSTLDGASDNLQGPPWECQAGQNPEIWFKITPTSSTIDIWVDNLGAGFTGTPEIILYAACGSGNVITSACPAGPAPFNLNATGLSPGTTYNIIISSSTGDNGANSTFTICVVDGGGACPDPSCPTCTDGIQNQGETQIDCGGPFCDPCPPSCTDGILNQDETAIDCGGVCPACPSCSDGILNQDETEIDCGGSICPACTGCVDCANVIQDCNETGVDCGGVDCPACPTCTDGITNQGETGVDCGGPCPACPTCSDGVQNGDELGIDCGGSCPACPICNQTTLFVSTPPIDTNGVYTTGYIQPDSTYNFCFTIDPFAQVECNYLHGIVPYWGIGWVDASFTSTLDPVPVGDLAGSWGWFADGVVLLNSPPYANPSAVGAGWFFLTGYQSHGGDPNLSYGDAPYPTCAGTNGDGTSGPWIVCFSLTSKDTGTAGCLQWENLSVAIKTYADVETGIYGKIGCLSDTLLTLGDIKASCDLISPGLYGSNVIDSTTIVDQTGKVTFDVLFTEPIVCGTVQPGPDPAVDFELGTNGIALTLGWLGNSTGTLAKIINAEPLNCHDPIARVMTDVPKDTTMWVRITLNIDSLPTGYNNDWFIQANTMGGVTLRDAGGNLFNATGGNAIVRSVVLPVELLYFTGYVKGTNVILEWATASEENNDYFSIQRSKDGKNFETIGTVDGAGTSNEVIEYLYVDKKPYKGVNYYRLKQTDYDGQESFSDIIKVNVNTDVFEIVDIYPVPAEGSVVITFNSNSEDFVNLTIFDITGKESMSEQYYAYIGFNSVSVKVSDLAKGVYFLHLEKNGERVYTKMLKD